MLKEEAKVKDPKAYHLLKKVVDYKIYFYKSLYMKDSDYDDVYENYKQIRMSFEYITIEYRTPVCQEAC